MATSLCHIWPTHGQSRYLQECRELVCLREPCRGFSSSLLLTPVRPAARTMLVRELQPVLRRTKPLTPWELPKLLMPVHQVATTGKATG